MDIDTRDLFEKWECENATFDARKKQKDRIKAMDRKNETRRIERDNYREDKAKWGIKAEAKKGVILGFNAKNITKSKQNDRIGKKQREVKMKRGNKNVEEKRWNRGIQRDWWWENKRFFE